MRLEGRDLVQLLANPSSVAVVGASADPRRLSGRPVQYLTQLGYAGRIHAVNPRTDLPGVDTVRSLRDLSPGSVDVALITTPPGAVVQALEEAEALGVRAAVIIGSGFEDRQSEPRLRLESFAASSSLRIIGPNCVGTLGVAASSYLTFSSVLQQDVPRSGRIGLVTQSGALGNSLLQSLIRRHVGLNQWFSTGNEIDTGAVELATGLLESDGVDAVGVFLEGVTDIAWLDRLERVLRESGKPMFVLKAAQSASGRQAAAGHTGRIVGSADASNAILAEVGVRAVNTVAELADALVVAGVHPKLRLMARPSVSLVSVSGAAGVIGADRVAQDGRLQLARIEPHDVQLDERLQLANPLDVPFIDETAAFADTVSALAAVDAVDVVVAVESSLAHDRVELVNMLVAFVPSAPMVLTSLSEDDQIDPELTRQLADADIAYLPTVERAVAAVAACAHPALPADLGAGGHPSQTTDVRGLEWIAGRLPEDAPWSRWHVQPDNVAQAADDLGYPLVVKAAGRAIEHRTELGAIQFVRSASELRSAVETVEGICAEHGDAVMLQEVAAPGFEVLISVVRDPEFGPVAFVRPGGTFAELMAGQAVVWGGWDAQRRTNVLRSSRIGELLSSYRGGKTYDLDALSRLLGSCLDAVAHDMSFLELNPVIVREDGLSLIDAVARA